MVDLIGCCGVGNFVAQSGLVMMCDLIIMICLVRSAFIPGLVL